MKATHKATVLAAVLASLAMFFWGFILPREVTTLRAPPSDATRLWRSWYGDRKVVMIIVDALRWDMRNMPSLGGRGWQLMSEAPTTTSQRLKSMTTGGIPAFMEIASAFDSDEVVQDNIITQLLSHNKAASVYGDDTWLSLYPSALWSHTAVFPSFNVWDLDTVDDGIGRALPEVLDDDFTVIHFLGIDHAGHRYGPRHPEMERKIRETDEKLAQIFEQVERSGSPTVVWVLGDHGMTDDGQHGGGTELEVQTVLHQSVYPNSGLQEDGRPDMIIEQVELVPTIATFLGIPVPYGNIGRVNRQLIKQACLSCDDPVEELMRYLTVLDANVKQVMKYLSSEMNVQALKVEAEAAAGRLRRLLASHEEDPQSEMGRRVFLAEGEAVAGIFERVINGAASSARQEWASMVPERMYLAVMGAALAAFLVCTSMTDPCGWLLLAPVVHALMLTSNSYVVCEDAVCPYILTSLLIWFACRHRSVAFMIAAVCSYALPLVVSRSTRSFGTHVLKPSLPIHDLHSPLELLYTVVLPVAAAGYYTKTSSYFSWGCLVLRAALRVAGIAGVWVQTMSWVCFACSLYERNFWCAAGLFSGPRGIPAWCLGHAVHNVLARNARLLSATECAVTGFYLSWVLFFSTGHQTVLSSIDFGSAFIGFTHLHHTVQGVLLVGFNTFSSFLTPSFYPSHRLSAPILASHLVLFAGALLATAVHRRHLMVWEVFAPRMLFGAVVGIVASVKELCGL
eukprot:TRINITY_DN5295_c0_g1_i1.p1 TRINITY_DN5295_c0_g1~~TRINITY_DN5295_c0_g1_i1.p1  ORF type:complete len:737 (+),score=127.07 TRINITY_DN5295_c0_g1_i1:921-3131(+)